MVNKDHGESSKSITQWTNEKEEIPKLFKGKRRGYDEVFTIHYHEDKIMKDFQVYKEIIEYWRCRYKEENDVHKHTKYLNQIQMFYEQHEDIFKMYDYEIDVEDFDDETIESEVEFCANGVVNSELELSDNESDNEDFIKNEIKVKEKEVSTSNSKLQQKDELNKCNIAVNGIYFNKFKVKNCCVRILASEPNLFWGVTGVCVCNKSIIMEIGNGIMNDVTDVKGTYDFLWSHALISDETYQRLRENCMVETKICQEFEDEGKTEFGAIDASNIYGPLCSHSDSPWKTKLLVGYYPCEGDYVVNYLNLPQVQEALHANKTNLPYSWQLCSDIIDDWKDSPSTVFPIYQRLISSGLRILIFSGDVDVIVSVTSTRYSIDAMNMKVIKPWHPWLDETNDVAGYQVIYEGLTFATVREAGHQVPEYQPRRAFALLKRFLAAEH